MAKLTGHKMRPVAIRSSSAEPIELTNGSRVHKWHLTMYEVRDQADNLYGYRLHTGEVMRAAEMIIEPGRKGAFCQRCAESGPLPK